MPLARVAYLTFSFFSFEFSRKTPAPTNSHLSEAAQPMPSLRSPPLPADVGTYQSQGQLASVVIATRGLPVTERVTWRS